MSITTNNHQRELVDYFSLPLEARDEFAYMNEPHHIEELCDARFFRYRGSWYDAFDFVRIESEINPPGMRAPFAHTVARGSELARWIGIQTDSHATAVVIRWGTDWDGSETTEAIVAGYWIAD